MFSNINLPGHGLQGRARLYEMLRCGIFWVAVLVTAYWAADRAPPMQVNSIKTTAAVHGGEAQVEMGVSRDTGRECSVTYHQFLVDADGYRFELPGTRYMSAAAIAAMERAHPGRIVVNVPVPQRAAPGRGRMGASLEYVCNPLQLFWPIPVELEVPIDIT